MGMRHSFHPSPAMPPFWILALLASASSIPLNQEQTPSWVNICQGTYLFSEDTKSWNDAYGECELYGAHIAQIDSLAENFCLLDYAHTAGLPLNWYYNSANDIMSEGVWRQYDEELISWTPWWYREDTYGGTGRNCGAVYLGETVYAGQWVSFACTELCS